MSDAIALALLAGMGVIVLALGRLTDRLIARL